MGNGSTHFWRGEAVRRGGESAPLGRDMDGESESGGVLKALMLVRRARL